MIKEDYVSFEIAKLLKEKGFDVYVRSFYEKDKYKTKEEFSTNNVLWNWNISSFRYSAPTLQMAMKWLRKKKGIAVIPVLSSVLDNEKFLWNVKIVVAKTNDSYSQVWVYETQESACEAAIKYCLENLI